MSILPFFCGVAVALSRIYLPLQACVSETVALRATPPKLRLGPSLLQCRGWHGFQRHMPFRSGKCYSFYSSFSIFSPRWRKTTPISTPSHNGFLAPMAEIRHRRKILSKNQPQKALSSRHLCASLAKMSPSQYTYSIGVVNLQVG